MSFSQCASTKKLESETALDIKEVFYKEWSNPARYTGSGMNLYVVVPSDFNPEITLDSVYFRNKQVKLEYAKENVYVGKFETEKNKPQDIVMSSDPKAEYGNAFPKINKLFPFELKEDECVVSYKEGKKTKYVKLPNIKKRQAKSTLDHRM